MKKYGVRCVIVFLSILFASFFIAQKEGYHMDEILAYELANAQYNPWIVPTQPQGRLAKFHDEYLVGETVLEELSNIFFVLKDTLENKGESILAQYKADIYEAPVWISKDMFQDYVRVDHGDAFCFSSVYFNVKDDNHPPLHFMLLHFISSITQGDVSVWQGGIINLIAMAGTLWLIGLIGDQVFEKKITSVATMILFGFSTAMIATSLWIRMYGVLTFFLILILYLHIKAFKEQGFIRNKKKNNKICLIGNIAIMIVTALAFWTQYFALFFVLPLAIVTAVLLYKDARVKELYSYIRTMFFAGILGVIVYPFSVGDVLFSGRGQEALSQWEHGIEEYFVRLDAFFGILAQNIMAHEILLALVLLIGICLVVSKKIIWTFASMMCIVPTSAYFLLAAKMSPYYVDRYIMAIFPLVAIICMFIIERLVVILCCKLKKEQCYGVVMLSLSSIIVIWAAVQVGGEYPYLYKGYEEQLELSKEYENYPLVCVYDGYGFYENVLEMEQYEQTMLIKQDELSLMDEDRIDVTKDGYVLLIKYPGEDYGEGVLEKVTQVFGGTNAKLLLKEGCHGDVIYSVLP